MIKKQKISGFTLVELSVVLMIIAVVASVSMNTYFKYILKSKASEAYVYLRSIHDAQFVFANQTVFTRGNLNQCMPQSRFSRIASSICDGDTYCNEINAKPPSKKKQYVYIYSTYEDNLFSSENCAQSSEFSQVGSWEALGLSSVDRNQDIVSLIKLKQPSILKTINQNFGIPSAHANLLDDLAGNNNDSDNGVNGQAGADVNGSVDNLSDHVDNLNGGNNLSDNDGSEIDGLAQGNVGNSGVGVDVDIDLDGDGDNLVNGTADGDSNSNQNGGQNTDLDVDLSLNMPGNGSSNSDDNIEDPNNQNDDSNNQISLVGDKINVIRLPIALNFSFYAAHDQRIVDAYGLDDPMKTISIFAVGDVDGDYTGGQITFPEEFENNDVNPMVSDNVWVISRSMYIDNEGDIQVTSGIYEANRGE